MIFNLFTKTFTLIKKYGIKKAIDKVVRFIPQQYQNKLWLRKITSQKSNIDYQNNIDFSGFSTKVKPVAFYLPQFHAIPENDKWWGKDFTEWTNTRKAKPKFKGHYQPREPHADIGYYDLTDIETLKKQIRLAKQHGIYGFCFYYYWFSGKRLLEKPLDLFLNNPELDINFCLCWANENWTRTWDGDENEMLIKQDYTNDDPYNFIKDVKKYVLDKRYIRIDGVPVILVYNPGNIPDTKDVFKKWKNYSLEMGIGEIKIFICKTFGHTPEILCIEDIVDGFVEFPPHSIPIKWKKFFYFGRTPTINDYEELVSEMKKELTFGNDYIESKQIPLYRTCMLDWDNSSRKVNNWVAFINFSLESFFSWVSLLTSDALHKNASQKKEPIFFINAWNEWGEGTYLEPDKKYGYAKINTFSKAICELPYN